MVKVEILEERDQDASPYGSHDVSRTSSSVSLLSAGGEEETFFERIAALVDIVPPTTRHNISSRLASTASFFKTGSKLVGNLIWIVTTSALLVGLPLALSLEDESKIVAQEKEMLAQQQGAQQVRGFTLALEHANLRTPRPCTSINIMEPFLSFAPWIVVRCEISLLISFRLAFPDARAVNVPCSPPGRAPIKHNQRESSLPVSSSLRSRHIHVFSSPVHAFIWSCTVCCSQQDSRMTMSPLPCSGSVRSLKRV